MASPTTTWVCDSCGTEISEPGHGWVEWLEPRRVPGEPRRGREVRVVHHASASQCGGCHYRPAIDYDDRAFGVGDRALKELLGPDGLTILLQKVLDEGLVREEAVELIRRLHVAGFDAARPYIEDAIEEGVFEPDNGPRCLLQRDVDAILEWVVEEQGATAPGADDDVRTGPIEPPRSPRG